MKFEPNDFGMTLSSGRTMYVSENVISVEEDGEGGFRLLSGYDNILDSPDEPFTHQENDEIADYMIDLWTRFKAARGR